MKGLQVGQRCDHPSTIARGLNIKVCRVCGHIMGPERPAAGSARPVDDAAPRPGLPSASARGVTAELVSVGPEYAAYLLKNRHKNRKINPETTKHYVRQMLGGEWLLTGEAIVLCRDGRLLDGQHRCDGVVRSGITIDTVLVRGVDVAAMRKQNTGRARQLAQTLGMLEIEKPTTFAAVCRVLIVLGMSNKHTGATTAVKLTDSDAGQVLVAYPCVPAIISEYESGLRPICRAVPMALALLSIFYEIDAEDATSFAEKLCTGLGFSGRTDPVYALREQMNRMPAASGSAPSYMVGEWTIRAWNAFRSGRECSRLLAYGEGLPDIDGGNPWPAPAAPAPAAPAGP